MDAGAVCQMLGGMLDKRIRIQTITAMASFCMSFMTVCLRMDVLVWTEGPQPGQILSFSCIQQFPT